MKELKWSSSSSEMCLSKRNENEKKTEDIELPELSLRHLKDVDYWKISSKNEAISSLSVPHIESFNYCMSEGIQNLTSDILPLDFKLSNDDDILIKFDKILIGKPRLSPAVSNTSNLTLYPKECTEKGTSYTAQLLAVVTWVVNGQLMPSVVTELGEVPIMVKSRFCNLYNMSPEKLVEHGEAVNDPGGHFIINGRAVVLRMLVANRRNHPLAISRDNWKNRDVSFTEKGILIRCVDELQSSTVNILHFLSTGHAKLAFTVNREIFFIPILMALKALANKTDFQIYKDLMKGRENDIYYSQKIKHMLWDLQDKELLDQTTCQKYIGKSFKHKFAYYLPPWERDETICGYLFKKYILIHLESDIEKYELLCFMTRKLYSYIAGECISESPDDLSMQEVSQGGHVYLQLLKDKLEGFLLNIRQNILNKNKDGDGFLLTEKEIRTAISHSGKIGPSMQTFLSTGRLTSKSTCGLMQTTGLTVRLERLNYLRDLSHLRAIHRGSFFLERKSIIPRRLTGEAWGFICPVHTPDGAPCGLLNHLSYKCIVLNEQVFDPTLIPKVMRQLGLVPVGSVPVIPYTKCYEVFLDGNLMGFVPKTDIVQFVEKLRLLKVKEEVFPYLEIVLVPEREFGGQYKGLFLFSTTSRLMRPVINLTTNTIEYVGTYEQLYLNIAVSPEDYKEGVHTHMETEKTAILSNIGKLVPFSNCNPIPRNMYQCQMGKQAMGTPFHNWQSQTEGKIYRLQTPQVPLVRNAHYDEINLEEYALGFNAVVAIVSYTGYDMEDAMVINKCSVERGFAHGFVYKSEHVNLSNKVRGAQQNHFAFKRDPKNTTLVSFLDESGLPYPGICLKTGDPYYCIYDVTLNTYSVSKYKGEDCVVDKYSIMGPQNSIGECQKANITIRIKRNPIIGDKFASRSGQKGIMSRLYPMEDLPFSERGIVPDIIFNPHGIPSRMTAGKLIELIGGKAAAEFGKSFDSTPFKFNDENSAVDYFGQILEKAGFNYYGEDVLYSGTDGRMLDVHIFEGIIYYQRLRHMTADKWQVRSTGSVDVVTRQPIKGRKRGGAIRFGEMERDCLISHGSPFTLKDRLFDCSDKTMDWICANCGGFLSSFIHCERGVKKYSSRQQRCRICDSKSKMLRVSVPYVFNYLIAELATVGINVQLGLKSADEFILGGEVGVDVSEDVGMNGVT